MPFQLLDLILGGIMIISGLLALMRGFTREVLSLVAWLAAAIAAYFAVKSPQLVAAASQYLEPPIVAQIAVAGAAFIVVLIVVSLISVKMADFVLDSAAGAFDRSLGFVYGLGRGLVLVVIAYLFYGWLTPIDRQEDWIKNARSLPIIKSTGELILSFVPPDIAQMLSNAAILGTQPAPDPNKAGDRAEQGYQQGTTQGLDQLIQGTEGQTAPAPAPSGGEQPAFGGEGTNPN